MPSMNDIAKIVGVSKATVSLALAGHPRISEETKAKVKEAALQIGYGSAPSQAAVPGEHRKERLTIGVLYVGANQSSTNGFFRDTLTGICNEGSMRQAHVVMIGMKNTGDEAEAEEVYDKVMESGASGIIVISGTAKLYGLNGLAARRFPMVFVGSRRLADSDSPLNSVSSDNFEGGVIATEHMVRHGHRKLAVVTGAQPLPWQTDRLNGFFSALRAAGIYAGEEAIIRIANPANPADEGWAALDDLGATAVFTTNSMLGHMALRHFRMTDRRVPEDVSLIAFDDTAFFPLENPPVTVVKQDMEALGTLSVKMLIDLIDNPDQPPRQILIPTCLIERSSCTPVIQAGAQGQ